MSLQREAFFDPATFTLTYVVSDAVTKDAIIIDSVLDYDPASSQVTFESVARVVQYIKQKELNPHAILETHAHADHLSGAQFLRDKFPGAKIAIGKNITKVQEVFKSVFNLPDLAIDGSQFDILLTEENDVSFGSIAVKTIFTPGHTPACSSYLIGDMLFTGDALFMPDYGTGRCDFPAGDAKHLYHSVHEKLYSLPDATRVFTGHDYQPGGREVKYESTIAEQKQNNIHIKTETSEAEFVKFRTERDAGLKAPRLLLPSVQINIEAGQLPKPEANNVGYLKIPVRVKS